MSLKNLFLFTVVVLLIGGCATKRYGRLLPVTGAEKTNYSCKDIQIERAKIDAFELQVEKGDEMDAMTIASYVGDFGIGNRSERTGALTSSRERRVALNDIAAEKGCQ